jgi:micrococcal nuclease
MRRVISALVLVVLWSLPAQAIEFRAKVIGVSDGDTLTVLTAQKKQIKIRLYGVDAPETGQDYGSRSKQAASAMAFGKTVTVQVKDTDRYDRTVAEIILPDGKSLNREMVRIGAAWHYRKYAPNDRELAALEREARDAKVGLWSQPNPVPPWEFRHPKVADVGQVVGNRNSHVYHAPNCPSVARMKSSNKVPFASATDDAKAGDCR